MDEDRYRELIYNKQSKVDVVPLTCTFEEFCTVNSLSVKVQYSKYVEMKYAYLELSKGHIEINGSSGASVAGYGVTDEEAVSDLRSKLTGNVVDVGISFGGEHFDSNWPLYKKYQLTLI